MKLDPILVPTAKKKNFLKGLTEDEFRDRVVRPLFIRMGLRNYREVHGLDEEGKDCVLVATSPLGHKEIYAIQTKKGNLSLARSVSSNLTVAHTQLRTSLETTICIPELNLKSKPHKVLLVTSGTINTAARKYVIDDIGDPRIEFYDGDSLIPRIDEIFPELWFGIDSRRNPYLATLRDHLVATGDSIPWNELGIGALPNSPVTDAAFMPLTVHRFFSKPVKRKGQVERKPDIEEFSIAKLLDHSERLIVLTGDAGDGKTTGLKRLAYLSAGQSLQAVRDGKIPVFVRCTDIVDKTESLVQIAGELTARMSETGQVAFTTEDLDGGLVLLLVDGLDEAPAGEKRHGVIKKLLAFHETHPRCQIVVTSRPYRSVIALDEVKLFKEFKISDFEIRKAKNLVSMIAQGRKLPGEAPQEIMRKLQSVHGFQMNPLLVTLFAATSDFNRRDVPPNITELFKKYTELMLGRWDLSKGLAQQIQPNIKDFLLQAIAIQMHRKKKTVLSLKDFNATIERCLQERGMNTDVTDFGEEILNRSGLMRIDGDTVEFRHLLLQEFFAGRAIERAEDVRPYVGDDWWRNPIVFYFGDRNKASAELEDLARELHGLEGPTLYNAAISVGLAVQACYLARLSEKREIMRWVLHALVRTYSEFTAYVENQQIKQPLTTFLDYYIHGRDAVGTSIVKELLAADRSLLPGVGIDEIEGEELEIYQFWCIAGLIEGGELDEAQKAIDKFKPKDNRLLLALHLGCFLVGNLRISTAKEKKIANAICKKLEPFVHELTMMVIDEFNTLILELREGQVCGLTAVSPEVDGDTSD